MPSGTVTELHRWPVKSLGGEPADALNLDPRGIAGDRAHALVHLHKGEPKRLTAREAPGMLRWRASYAGVPGAAMTVDDVPLPTLTAPDGTAFSWDDPDLPAALSDDLGREVTLKRDLALMQDLNNSILVTTQATIDAVARELGRELDLRRFRTNVHVVLDDDTPPYAEESWEGRRLQVGDVTLDLLHPCERCVIPTRDPDTQVKDPNILKWLTRERRGLFGINARVGGGEVRGTVRVGDQVALV